MAQLDEFYLPCINGPHYGTFLIPNLKSFHNHSASISKLPKITHLIFESPYLQRAANKQNMC